MTFQPVVAPDLDGCGYPFTTAFARNLERDLGITLPPIVTFNFFEAIGWTGQDFVNEMIRQIAECDLFASEPPIDGFVAGMRVLRKEGLYVRIQTARCFTGVEEEATRQTKQWLDAYDIPYDELVNSNEKQLVNYAFDDSPKQIAAYQKLGVHTVIVDQPWNQEAQGIRAIDAYHAASLIALDYIEGTSK